MQIKFIATHCSYEPCQKKKRQQKVSSPSQLMRDLGIRNVLLISVQPTVALFSVYCKRQLSSY
jgi:hypothetical protein